MRALPVVVAVYLLLLSASQASAQGLPDFTRIVKANKPAVVNISTTRKVDRTPLPPQFEWPEDGDQGRLHDFLRHFFGMPESEPGFNQEAQSLGSGFIISKDGYVVTNHHVVKGADEIIVRLDDRRELIATVVGVDPRSDIALLKIEANKLPTVRLGNAAGLEIGEWVLAIGSPFGFEQSVTAGIVSAKGQPLPNESYVPFLQTDVAINPGNSGGPLFNLAGEVVGVNSQIYSRTGGFMGLSFAIPIELVLDVVDQLKTTGRVSRGWLGVLIQEVTQDLAESFGMDKPQGALVSKVLADSPAQQGRIQVGDIILSFNDQIIDRTRSLPPLVGQVKAGQTAEVVVLREGKKRSLTVEIGELPEAEDLVQQRELSHSVNSDNRLGLVVQDLDSQTRQEYDIAQGGVVVANVKDGPAAAAGIRQGDVITSLNNKPIAGAQDFLEKMQQAKARESVALLVQRDGGPIYLALRIPDDE